LKLSIVVTYLSLTILFFISPYSCWRIWTRHSIVFGGTITWSTWWTPSKCSCKMKLSWMSRWFVKRLSLKHTKSSYPLAGTFSEFILEFYLGNFFLFFLIILYYYVFRSPYFQRLFSETPCKHPVIVLKDLPDWEMRAIIHFMYKGEINVGQEQLPLLLQAAETLQVRKHYIIISAIRDPRKT